VRISSILQAIEQPWQTSAGSSALRMMELRQSFRARQETALEQNKLNLIDYNRTRAGWLENIQGMAARMSELSVLANDSTKNPVDRMALQTEFNQMQQGIRAITTGPYASGKFNGLFLFQG
jgi:flagellin-like hook-associated protein FlgL